MKLSEEQLKEVQEFAEALTPPADIAKIISVDEKEFVKEIVSGRGKIFEAFTRGKLLTDVKLRKTNIAIAQQGSSPALTLAMKMSRDIDLKIKAKKI